MITHTDSTAGISSVFQCCRINLIIKLFCFCDCKLNGMDLPGAFLLRLWEWLYYWNVFGVSWLDDMAFEVGGNQCPANHVDVVFQDSKKQFRVYYDLVKDWDSKRWSFSSCFLDFFMFWEDFFLKYINSYFFCSILHCFLISLIFLKLVGFFSPFF